MDWKWSTFWTTLWNMLIFAVTLQWTRLAEERDDFVDWWSDLWDRTGTWANSIATAVRDEWSEWKSSISTTASNAWTKARDIWSKLGSTLQNYEYSVGHYILIKVGEARNAAIDLFNDATDLVYDVRDSIYAAVYPYVDSWIAWVRGLFDWIQDYRDLITSWLVGVKGVIDWLKDTAWNSLQAFLANPIGWVLGWLLTPVTNIVNWWALRGGALHDFVTEDMPRLRNLLARGFSFLSNFVDHPLDTVLDLLAPVVIDWLEDRILERW